ncbi:MAG: NAD(P)/FAD-dependent oxidoreductase [SAR324 cluster bacterium]|nr:NAD(P)/FAD-dependent oxidoreductase [SAR324 cluster bacterium]
MKKIIIVGGGFAGLNAAKKLAGKKDVDLTIIDKRNYHLFQPLLYQVAMSALSPADIAQPIRSLFTKEKNVRVLQEEVIAVDRKKRQLITNFDSYEYDYLILSCGVQHSYFGHEEWEEHAPGLKNLEQAREIRKRVLTAFELAEKEKDTVRQKQLLTFVVIGGGPTGVELAGAIGEMTRYTLAHDFNHIDPKISRIILIEAGERILPSFDPKLSSRVTRDLEHIGVQVWTKSMVTNIDSDGVNVGEERIQCSTVLWGAGVQAVTLNQKLDVERDRLGRVVVTPELCLKDNPEVFVIGDQAHFCPEGSDQPLPGIAPVAMQQGRFTAKNILAEIKGEKRKPFVYVDKGQMATIGSSRAIVEVGSLKLVGFVAWVLWLVIHIYYLLGFKNQFSVMVQWTWSYLSKARGARLIEEKDWRFYPKKKEDQD